jgi:Zinc-finger associated domain (zf-AD)
VFAEETHIEDDDTLIPEYLDEEEIIVEEIGDEEPGKSETNELICRICLSHALSEYITEYHEHDIQAQIINECTGINVSAGAIPSFLRKSIDFSFHLQIDEPGTLNTICYSCVTSIRAAHQLRQTAVESDATLKERKLLKAKKDAEASSKPDIEVIDYFQTSAEGVLVSLPKHTTVKKVVTAPFIKQEKGEFTTKRLTVKKLVPKSKRTLKNEDEEDIFDDEPLSNWCIVDETTKNTVDRSKPKLKRAVVEERVKKKYNPPPLVCEVCAKVCRGKRFLEEHMNTHTGARVSGIVVILRT